MAKIRTTPRPVQHLNTTTPKRNPRDNLAPPFKPGEVGNPNGRPLGARQKLGEAFWRDLHECWQASGKKVLAGLVESDPATVLRAIAGLMPREIELAIEAKVYGISAKPTSMPSWEAEHGATTDERKPAPLVIDHKPDERLN